MTPFDNQFQYYNEDDDNSLANSSYDDNAYEDFYDENERQFPPFPGGSQGPRPRPRPRPPYDDHNNQKPQGRPPMHSPQKAQSVKAVDPGSIRGCLYRYTYIWLRNGQQFWMYPTFIGRRSVSGYRWMGFGWAYTGFDLRLVDSFYCTRGW